MNEFKGTPGPWMLTREWVEDGDGSEVEFFSVKGHGEDDLILEQPIDVDDARLIAAAPQLLAALQLMVSTYPYSPPCHGWESQVEAHVAATQAIAKALGK